MSQNRRSKAGTDVETGTALRTEAQLDRLRLPLRDVWVLKFLLKERFHNFPGEVISFCQIIL